MAKITGAKLIISFENQLFLLQNKLHVDVSIKLPSGKKIIKGSKIFCEKRKFKHGIFVVKFQTR